MRVEWRSVNGIRHFGFLTLLGGNLGPWYNYDTRQPRVPPNASDEIQLAVLLRTADLSPTPERVALWVALALAP